MSGGLTTLAENSHQSRTKAAPPAESANVRKRLGYLLKCFPRISETFILNEVLELERQGFDLCVYSMITPQEGFTHRLFASMRSPVAYLPYPLWSAPHRYAFAHMELFGRHPLRYLATLAAVISSLDLVLLERFVQAGLLARWLRRDGVEHLHAGFVHEPGSLAWIVHRITGIPFSLAAHAKDYVHSPRNLLRTKLAESGLVLTCTQSNVRALEERAAPRSIRRLRRIYHGVDLERFRFEPCDEADPPLILSVGRLVEKKGLDHLVSACALLRDRGRRFQVRIVAGSRDLWDELTGQIRRLDLAHVITLEGPLDQEEVRARYRSATIFALPCVVADDGDRDGIPNVLVEAAATGVPIVSTPVGGVPELVTDGETGLLVPARDPAALAAALERLLDSPALRRALRQKARAFVEESFDVRRNAWEVAIELTSMLAPRATTITGFETIQERAS